MSIRIRYTEYKNNPDATQWSIARSYIAALFLPIILVLTIVFQKIIGSFIEGDLSYIIALVLAIAAEVVMIVFCVKKEKQSVLRKLPQPAPMHAWFICPKCGSTWEHYGDEQNPPKFGKCWKCGYTETEEE